MDFTSITYYFDENGAMLTGWQTINDITYYFDENGAMLTGWQTINDITYYFDENGAMLTGWQTVQNYKYFFNDDGSMAVSTTLDGFVIGDDGIAITSLKSRVNAITASANTPNTIYSYVTSNYRYKYIEATKTFDQITEKGWDKYVEYLMNNKVGVCYYLAACMDYFMQNAGYTTRMVHAVHSSGDHYWCQVYIDGAWLNYDPTYSNRGNIGWNTIINLGNYTVLGYVYVTYDPYTGEYIGAEQRQN